MSTSVVGFDIGSFSSYVVVAKQGGVESVANEYSDRNSPTCVSFGEKMRLIGHEAKQQQISNIKNTICAFNRFVGKNINDLMVLTESKRNLGIIVEVGDQRVGFKVNYLGKTEVFSAEQVYAMQLTKLKEIAEMNLRTKVVDVVINVPTNATDSERRAILDSARIANLNCVRIINDTTACALAYGFYRQDLPDINENSNIVAFVDMGYSNLQSALVAFNKGKLNVIASSCDNIGGRDLDEAIYNYITLDFKERYGLIVEDDSKSGVRLMQECEKLKKLMSANSTSIPMNIECFMNDIDVSFKMCRAEFEKICFATLLRVRKTLEKLLKEGGITPDKLDSVEITGGSTRVSAVKDIIFDVFKNDLRTSLNSDEAVAKGCAIQCAILSPALRVKEFNIVDTCPYPIILRYDEIQGVESVNVFPKWNQFPVSKQITFERSDSFKLEAVYGDCSDLPTSNKLIGFFNVMDVGKGLNGRLTKVNVKLRINASGIFTCCQAQRLKDVEPDDIINGDIKNTNDNIDSHNGKKTVLKGVDLPMQAIILQYMPAKISEFNDLENQMIMQVKLEKQRVHAKNSVEEYIYEMKDKLNGSLESFISKSDREKFTNDLSMTEDWLYEEGEDVDEQLYLDRLTYLRKIGDTIMARVRETRERPVVVEEFSRLCASIQKVISSIDNKDRAFSYLGPEDREVLAKVLGVEQAWFSQAMIKQRLLAVSEDPYVTVAQIYAHKEALEMVAGPIIDRPQSTLNRKTTDNETCNEDNVQSTHVQQQSDMDLD